MLILYEYDKPYLELLSYSHRLSSVRSWERRKGLRMAEPEVNDPCENIRSKP